MNLGNNNSNTAFKSILDGMPYGIIVVDINKFFIYFNNVAKSVFNNISIRSEHTWTNDHNVYKVDKKTRITKEDSIVLRTLKGEIVSGEKLYIANINNNDGIFIKTYSFPIYNSIGVIEVAIIVFEDITKDELYLESIMKKITELEKYLIETLNIDYAKIIAK